MPAPPPNSRARARALRALQITADEVVARAEILARIARAGPGFALELRDPDLDARALHDWGCELRRATRAAGALFFVNDRLDLALALEADGVHLGRGSLAVADAKRLAGECLISCSAHDLDDVRGAADAGADLVVLSPIFESPGKGAPLGIELLARARASLPAHVGLIALGGVDGANAQACFSAGAGAVASIRADLTGVDRPS